MEREWACKIFAILITSLRMSIRLSWNGGRGDNEVNRSVFEIALRGSIRIVACWCGCIEAIGRVGGSYEEDDARRAQAVGRQLDFGQRPRGDNHRHVAKNEVCYGEGPDGDGEGQQGKRLVDDQWAEEQAAAATNVDVWKRIGGKGRCRRDVRVWVSEVRVRDVWVEGGRVSKLGVAEVDAGAVGRRVGQQDVIRGIAHAGAGDADEPAVAAAGGVARVEAGLQQADGVAGAHGALEVGAGIGKGVGRVLVVEVDKGLLQQDARGDGLADGQGQLQLRGDLRRLELGRQRQAVGLDLDDEVVHVDPCRDGEDGEGDEDGGQDKRGELLSDGDSHFRSRRASAMRGIVLRNDRNYRSLRDMLGGVVVGEKARRESGEAG